MTSATLKITVVSTLALMMVGCAQRVPAPPAPTSLVLPKPNMNNQGKYMFPYTQDGVLTAWTDKVVAAKGASQVGGAVGAFAGQKALEQVPFVGGLLGNMAGEAIGKGIVLNAAGGMDKIKETSDVSFDNPSDYCVYAYAKYADHKHYASAMNAAGQLYSEVNEQNCMNYISMAPKSGL